MIVGFLLMTQATPQLEPPTPLMMSIEALTDSAERQTLPAYEVNCKLYDGGGKIGQLKLKQTGGRGVRGTRGELSTLPAWRSYVSTPVSLKVIQDDNGLFENSLLGASTGDKPSRLETYRWDELSRPRYDSLMQFRDGKTWVMIQLTDTPEQSDNASAPLVYGAVITRRRDNRNLPGAHLGFCSIESNPQKPLSQAEETRYRDQ